ncbi:MAG TPA: hypothetical protein PLY94_12720, partial [Gemmatimonadaceae bacterium]|nr:hypothetical protein [Gemmatimonadaceae bacterium]
MTVVTTACDIDGPLQGASATVSSSQGVQNVILADGLEADCENGYAFLSQIPLKQGTNTFQVWLYDQAWNPVNGTLVIYADYVIPPVHVEPERPRVLSNPGVTLYGTFLVSNPREDSLTFRFGTQCTGAATCVGTPDSVRIAPDAWQAVRVGYSVAGSTADTGRVHLRATETTDTTNTALESFTAVLLPVGAVVDRGLCVRLSLGASASAECGDLRLTHALPSVRTLNQVRTPMLSYVSEHASPRPILSIDATLPGGSGTPDSVVTTVTVDGRTFRREVAGSQFTPAGTVRRTRLLLDSLSLATGLHPYTIAVWRYSGSDSSLLASDSAETIIVDR